MPFFLSAVWAGKCSHTSWTCTHTHKHRVLSFASRQQKNRHSNKPRRQHWTQLVRHYNTSLLSVEPHWAQLSWAVPCYSLVFNIAGNMIKGKHTDNVCHPQEMEDTDVWPATDQPVWHRIRQVVYRWGICSGHKQQLNPKLNTVVQTESERQTNKTFLDTRFQVARKPVSIDTTT